MPVMPMATPMSAALRAGASLTPSPVMATTLPLCLSSRTRRSLSSGATRATTPISGSWASSSSSLMAANSAPVMARPSMPSSPAMARRRGRVVAGDHPHPDAGVAALGDGRLGLGARRVDDPDHGQQGQVLDQAEQVAGGVEGRRVEVALGHHHHPLARLGDAVVGLRGQRAVLVGDRDQGPVGIPVGAAARDQHVRGALDIAAHHRLAARAGHLVEGGHELVVGVERHLGDPGVAAAGLLDVEPALGREHDQGALGRVADQVSPSSTASAHRIIGSRYGSRSMFKPPTCWISPSVE